MQKNVNKGLVESERPSKGKEREVWPQLVERFQDKVWKSECVKRDEKFEMNFTSAVRCSFLRLMFLKLTFHQNKTYAALVVAEEQLQSGRTDQALAHVLVDESQDILAKTLNEEDKKVY